MRGRAHDLLWMASLAAHRAGETSTVYFQVIRHLGCTSRQTYNLTHKWLYQDSISYPP